MSVKIPVQTTTDKILNSDIYKLTDFVDDIKKVYIDGVDNPSETLQVGMYGYLGYEFASLLQNSIVVASELANEAIPTRAKFDRNVITHALSLGIKKVQATAASMKVFLIFPEKQLLNNMVDGVFVLSSTTPIMFDDIEFHTDYDIRISKTNLDSSTIGSRSVDYVYTGVYDMRIHNSESSIENAYLPPIGVYRADNDNMVVVTTTIHQVMYNEIDTKIVGNDNLANKTINFSFEDQLSHFTVSVYENNSSNPIDLIPYYDGLYNKFYTSEDDTRNMLNNYIISGDIPNTATVEEKHCYYQYINSNTIRIRFDPDSYQPRTNANVIIRVWTSKGADGNFEYSEDLTVRLNSNNYTNLYMIVKQRGDEGSTGGINRKTVPELQKIIPKEALSRGSVTTTTDLRNYFNSINNENSVLHVFRKEDNSLRRIYYTYSLMKDEFNNVVPTNTIPIYEKIIDESKDGTGNIYIQSGEMVYFRKDETKPISILSKNYIGYKNLDVGDIDHQYEYSVDGVSSPDYKQGEILRFCIYNGQYDPEHGHPTQEDIDAAIRELSNWHTGEILYSDTDIFGNSASINVVYPSNDQYFNDIFVTQTLKTPSKDTALNQITNGDTIIAVKYVNNNFIYTIPLSMIINSTPPINNNPRINANFYLDVIDENSFLDYTHINTASPYQYIASYVKVKRDSWLSNQNIKYTIDVEVTPNIGEINEETIARTVVIGVYYDKNNKAKAWAIGKYISSSDGVSLYRFNLFTLKFSNENKNPVIIEESDGSNKVYMGANSTYKEYITNKIGSISDDIDDINRAIEQTTDPETRQELEKQREELEELLAEYNEMDSDYQNSIFEPSSISESSIVDTDSGVYMDLNTHFRVYTLYKYINSSTTNPNLPHNDERSVEYLTGGSNTNIPLSVIVPFSKIIHTNRGDDDPVETFTIGDMVLTNIYDTHDGINFLYNFSNLMNSYVQRINTNGTGVTTSNPPSISNPYEFIINRVPCIRYFYLNEEYKIVKFIKEMKRKMNYVLDAIDPLEETFGLDYKFFNTYGPSRIYYTTNKGLKGDEPIDNVSLSITFRTKFYNEDNDKTSIIPQIKDKIKEYIEDITELNNLHFPNLTTEIESKFSQYIMYFEYVGFNIYDANKQHIITDANMESLATVPEFLNVNIDDITGLPFINIEIVSQ